MDKLGIRLSGPRLGRPPKYGPSKAKLRQEREDASERNHIEGKLSFGLGRIRVRLANTSQSVIALQCLVMNLERRLWILYYLFFRWLQINKIKSWAS